MYFLKVCSPKVYFSKCIFAKCTRLACLLSFASLFLWITARYGHLWISYFGPDLNVCLARSKLFSKDSNLGSLKGGKMVSPTPPGYGRDWSVGLRPCGRCGGDLGGPNQTNQWGCSNLKSGCIQPSNLASTNLKPSSAIHPTWEPSNQRTTNLPKTFQRLSNPSSVVELDKALCLLILQIFFDRKTFKRASSKIFLAYLNSSISLWKNCQYLHISVMRIFG